jgi:hypothetical protein
MSEGGERHYEYGICRACGGRAAYPASADDPLSGGNYHCLVCGTRGSLDPSPASEEELELLRKADTLIEYVPSKIAEAREEVAGGRKLFYDKEEGEIRPGKRTYIRPVDDRPLLLPQTPGLPGMDRAQRRQLKANLAKYAAEQRRRARIQLHEKLEREAAQ